MVDSALITLAVSDWLVDLEASRSLATYQSYSYAMDGFEHWLKEQRPKVRTLDQLNVPVLQHYVASLIERGLSNRTLHHYVGILVRWLQAMVDEGEITGICDQRGRVVSPAAVRDVLERGLDRLAPPVAPRMPDLRRLPAYYDAQLEHFLAERGGAVPSPDERAPVRTYLNLQRNRTLLATLFCTGGRVNEVLSLDRMMVERDGVIAQATQQIKGKGRKRRPLFLDDLAREWITAYLAARDAHPRFPDAAPLFVSHGPQGIGQRLSDVTAWKVVKEAAEAYADLRAAEGAPSAEIDAIRAVSPHGLRHFLGQAMLDEGADYKDVAAALGHSSTVVTEQVYARLGDDRVMEIVDQFAPRATRSFRRPSSKRSTGGR